MRLTAVRIHPALFSGSSQRSAVTRGGLTALLIAAGVVACGDDSAGTTAAGATDSATDTAATESASGSSGATASGTATSASTSGSGSAGSASGTATDPTTTASTSASTTASTSSSGTASTTDSSSSTTDTTSTTGSTTDTTDTTDTDTTTGGPACEGEPGNSGTALQLDGAGDHVSMGVAPALGLDVFTLEAWIYRTGAGQTASSGVGGVVGTPIIAKGRGEEDGNNLDCNYFFAVDAGGRLVADFEDDSGAGNNNHPVQGTTAIPFNEWHHVAVTFDGAAWTLYLDGQVDGTAATTASPRQDSIQHFAIGAALNSTGAAEGAFQGAIDEVRVWNVARTQAELDGARRTTVASGAGLLGRWALDAPADVTDSVGANDGTLQGDATLGSPAAVLDQGEPPVVTVVGPADGATVTGAAVDLAVDVTDPEGDDVTVTFYVSEAAEDFTVVVLPDTQYYSDNAALAQNFITQTQWTLDNREALNIKAVIHNGDIVEDGNSQDEEWQRATAALYRLESALPGLPDGLPYAVNVGNHDSGVDGAIGQRDQTQKYNEYFGIDHFMGRTYYGGHYGADNDNWFMTFSAAGIDFLVINLEWDRETAVFDWARQVLRDHPNHVAILNQHYILNSNGTFGAQGSAAYNALRTEPNLRLTTCGHIGGESRREDVFGGVTVFSMLADFQFYCPNGATSGCNDGDTWTRIWKFSPSQATLKVETYNIRRDVYRTGAQSEFTLPLDLSDFLPPPQAIGTVDPVASGARATLPFTGLTAGRTYAWYAEVSDCGHVVRTAPRTFTAQ